MLVVAIIAILVAPGIIGYLLDRSAWNGGICPETGGRWELRDTDSQGGRLYRSGEHTIWVSWWVDSDARQIP